jgi:hypothetical protein
MNPQTDVPKFSHQKISLRQINNFKGEYIHEFNQFHPVRQQYRILYKLIKGAKNTRVGRTHKFSDWLQHRGREEISLYELLRELPIQGYDDWYKEYLEPNQRLDADGNVIGMEGEDLFWPGPTSILCATAGTTRGTKKIVPFSDRLVHEGNQAALHFISSYLDRKEKSQLLQGNFFYVTTPCPLRNKTDTFYVGDRYAVAKAFGTFLSRIFGFPARTIDRGSNFNDRCGNMVRDLVTHKYVTGLCGRPDWLDRILEEVLVHTGKEYFDDIQPMFEGIVYGGNSSAQYLESLRGKFRKRIEFMEMYPTTEAGMIGFQLVDEDRMRFTPYYGVFFEFEDAEGAVVPVDGVETGREYSLIVTTGAGLWRYRLGDKIRFHTLDPLTLDYVVRDETLPCRNHEIGERTCHQVIEGLQKHHWAGLHRFHVGADGGSARHVWIFELDRKSALRDGLFGAIDEMLKDLHGGYRESRQSGSWNEPLVISFTPDLWDRVVSGLADGRPTSSRLPVVLRPEIVSGILTQVGMS